MSRFPTYVVAMAYPPGTSRPEGDACTLIRDAIKAALPLQGSVYPMPEGFVEAVSDLVDGLTMAIVKREAPESLLGLLEPLAAPLGALFEAQARHAMAMIEYTLASCTACERAPSGTILKRCPACLRSEEVLRQEKVNCGVA